MTSAAGLVTWLHHWYCYLPVHILSIAVAPTCTSCLIRDFKYSRKFEINCSTKPSMYAYPKMPEEKKEEKKKGVKTVALLSTTKNKTRLARKRAKEEAKSGEETASMETWTCTVRRVRRLRVATRRRKA
jgi:26S proteasome regulatory subunit N2